MFKTHAGPVEGEGHDVYLRPETAQGMFTNFKLVQETARKTSIWYSPNRQKFQK